MEREQVIKGLEVILEDTADMFYRSTIQDAIALLKAQEPVKPYAVYSEHTGTKWLVCGACDEPMNKVRDETWSNYCPNCGRAVKWE